MKRRRGNPWAPVLAQPTVQAALAAQQDRRAAAPATAAATGGVSVAATAPAATPEDKLNKTERAWLARRRADPAVEVAIPHAFTLVLSDPEEPGRATRYVPDIFIVYKDGALGFDEVKGAFVRDAGKVKFEWARRAYPWFRWRWCQKVGGTWTETEHSGKRRLSVAE